MRVIYAFVMSVAVLLMTAVMPVSAQVQTDLNDDTQLAYAYAMNDLSVQIVAVIYNYAGITYEAFEGGTLDATNAQYELEYVENILYKSKEAIDGIVSTVDEGHPVYEILYPHLLCYDYFIDYTSALYTYFGDSSDVNYQAVVDARAAVEPYMRDIGLIIETRGEGSDGEG